MAGKIFKIWLVGCVGPSSFEYDCWGEGTAFAVGCNLRDMFNKICKHKNSEFSYADFFWEPGYVSDQDVVVYLLGSQKSSIIKQNGGTLKHANASGNTFQSNKGMISEVYLKKMDGALDFSKVVANIIFHEIMHNKLDAATGSSIADIHVTGGDGLAKPSVDKSTSLTDKNISLMAGALSKKISQYTAEMQKPAF